MRRRSQSTDCQLATYTLSRSVPRLTSQQMVRFWVHQLAVGTKSTKPAPTAERAPELTSQQMVRLSLAEERRKVASCGHHDMPSTPLACPWYSLHAGSRVPIVCGRACVHRNGQVCGAAAAPLDVICLYTPSSKPCHHTAFQAHAPQLQCAPTTRHPPHSKALSSSSRPSPHGRHAVTQVPQLQRGAHVVI